MTTWRPDHSLVLAMMGWDDVKPTSECLHCRGTGRAPGNGRTECGFCDNNNTDNTNQKGN